MIATFVVLVLLLLAALSLLGAREMALAGWLSVISGMPPV